VNPDSMLVTVWAAFLFLAARMVMRGPSARRLAGLAVVVAVSLLTHGRGIAIVPPALLAVLLAFDRHRPGRQRGVRIAGAAVVLLAAWLLWSALSGHGLPGPYGGEINVPPEARHPGQFLSFVWQFYLPKLPFMGPRLGPAYGFNQVYIVGWLGGRFGSLDTLFSQQVYDLVQALVFSALLLGCVAVVTHARALRVRWDVVVLLVATAFSLVLFLHFASFRALSTEVDKVDPLIVGRYLLPLTPLYGIAVAALAGAAGRRSLQAGGLALGLALVLQLGALGLALARFYG
jgi:4-amino-4-deoxy-L-arabinose transferase-like glycosyltransferase